MEKRNRYVQDLKVLRANGAYGHLGGRPKKQNPQENPDTPLDILENPQQVLEHGTVALQRLAFGYSVGNYHFPPNLKALQILMERSEKNLYDLIKQEITAQVTYRVRKDVLNYYIRLFHEKGRELNQQWLFDEHSRAIEEYKKTS